MIKTYVRAGLGVGVVATMAFDAANDKGLVALPAAHLFAPSTTKIGFRKGTFLRGYMFEFIETFAPHLTKPVVEEAMQQRTQEAVDRLFATIRLPTL